MTQERQREIQKVVLIYALCVFSVYEHRKENPRHCNFICASNKQFAAALQLGIFLENDFFGFLLSTDKESFFLFGETQMWCVPLAYANADSIIRAIKKNKTCCVFIGINSTLSNATSSGIITHRHHHESVTFKQGK